MAGTVTVTTTTAARTLKKYSAACVSTAGGAVSANPITFASGGVATSIKIVPASGGTQPTDLFDVTVVDADGVDILGGQGGDCSNAVGEYFQLDPPIPIASGGTLDVVIANAGSAKAVRVDIFVEGVRE